MKHWNVNLAVVALFLAFLLAGCMSGESGQSNTPAQTANPVEVTSTPTEPLDAPVLASSLLQFNVIDSQGQPVARVTGLLLDMLEGQIPFLGVDLQPQGEGRPVLAPWHAFTLEATAPGAQNETPVDAALLLNLPGETLTGAPVMDRAKFRGNRPMTRGWDDEARDYWSTLAEEIPLTGAGTSESPDAQAGTPLWISGGQLQGIDYDVLDLNNQALGEVKDFIVNSDGAVTFAVIAPGEQLDLNDQMTLVPWQGLRWLPDESAFLLNLPVEAVEQAPRLDPESLPDFTLPGWDIQWSDYWYAYEISLAQATSQPEKQRAAVAPLFASDLIGTRLIDQNNIAVGQVEDWTLDPRGASRYVIVAAGGRLIPVSWQGLAWNEEQVLLLTVAASVLEDAPSYRSVDELAGDENWIKNSDRFWSQYIPVGGADNRLLDTDIQAVGFARRILDTTVVGVEDNEVGQVADFLLDASGNVLYVIVTWQNQFHPLPWQVFDYDFEQNRLLYLDDPQRLPEAPGFNSLQEISVEKESWDTSVRQYWGLK